MPALKGTVQDSDGNALATDLFFVQANSSLYSGSIAYRPVIVKARSSPDGSFNVSLPTGTWDMQVNGVATLQMELPNTSQTYNVGDVVSASIPTVPSTYLPLAGGTMTGYIVLHADPTLAMHPVSKQHLDAWAGSANITTLGTITTGTWTATRIDFDYIETMATASILGRNTAGTGSVEVLTTIPSAVQDNITRVGTIVSGTWNGATIDAAYIGSHGHDWSDITNEPTTLAGYGITDAAPLSHVGAGGTSEHPAATTLVAGFMSASDKSKLDGIESGANAGIDSLGGLTDSSQTFAVSNWTNILLAWSHSGSTHTIAVSWTGRLAFTYVDSIATQTILGRNTAGTGDIEELTPTTAKTILALDNVENTALSTWAGSTNLTTLGTVTSGTWNGSDIAFAYLAQIATASVLGRNTAGTGDIEVLTTLPTAVQDNITRLGTVTSAVFSGSSCQWEGGTIAYQYGGTGTNLGSGNPNDVLGIIYKQSTSALGVVSPLANAVLVTASDKTPSLSTNIPNGVTYNSNHIVNAASSTKTTAGAPFTNDGYVTVVINGTSVKVMTTA